MSRRYARTRSLSHQPYSLFLLYCLAVREEAKAFLLTFISFYLLYLIYETWFFFSFEVNLKRKFTIIINTSMNPMNPPGANAPRGRFRYQWATLNTITSNSTLLYVGRTHGNAGAYLPDFHLCKYGARTERHTDRGFRTVQHLYECA